MRWAAVHAGLVAYAAGWATIPGAVVGIGRSLVRPAFRAERAFAGIATGLLTGLVLEAALFSANGSPRFHERYLMAAVPFVAPAFFLAFRPGTVLRRSLVVTSVGMALVALGLPLTSYAAGVGTQDSPMLAAYAEFANWLGVGGAALAVLLVAHLSLLATVVASSRPRVGVPAALFCALLATLAMSIGSTRYEWSSSDYVAATFFAQEGPDWIDKAEIGNTAVLVTPGTDPPVVSAHLFWNRDLTRLLRLPGSSSVDAFGTPTVRIDSLGRLRSDGRPVSGPLLVEEYAASLDLADTRLVRREPASSLWAGDTEPRVITYSKGRYFDGWLAMNASVTVWPGLSAERAGTLRFSLSLPLSAKSPAKITLSGRGMHRRVTIEPGTTRAIQLPITARHPTRVRIRASNVIVLPDGRIVTVQATRPHFADARGAKGPAARSR